MDNSKLLTVLGPTAVGKSSLGVELAKKFNGEIISADSRQIYSELNIGSGKVTEREKDCVRHHLLDVTTLKDKFSVSDFEALSLKAIKDIQSRGKLPIVVGGTGFYIKAILFENAYANAPKSPELRERMEALDTNALFSLLKDKDSDRAAEIDQKNRRRLIRALEIVEHSGSVSKKDLIPRFNHTLIGVRVDRETLSDLIDKRLKMRWNGIIAEVLQLLSSGISLQQLEDLGLEYRYISRMVSGALDEESAKAQLSTEIKRYAKRQMTFFNSMEGIKWFYRGRNDEICEYIRSTLI